MTLREYCRRYKISVKKARQQFRDGVLRLEDEKLSSKEIYAIELAFKRGNPISVQSLCYLLGHKGEIVELGRWADDARDLLEALGDVTGEAAPPRVAATISEAARNQDEALAILVPWILSILPDYPVTHSYIASRLVMGLPENQRAFNFPRLARAMNNCRAHADFSAFWQIKSEKSRNVTYYQKKGFDL